MSIDPEICSNDDRSSEKNSEVCTEERTKECHTPEKISVIHSEDCIEERSSSEIISAVCSALFRQQQTDKQTQCHLV